MRSEPIAEWLIGRFTTESRAASIVGDLAEARQQRGSRWFWLSFAQVTLALMWRRPFAFFAAFYAGPLMFSALRPAVIEAHAPHGPTEHPWMAAGLGVLLAVYLILWTLLFYAAVRYGFTDRLTRLALPLAALTTASICLWRQPAIIAASVALSIPVVWVSTSSVERPKAALAVLVAVIAGVASGFACGGFSVFILSLYQRSGHLFLPGTGTVYMRVRILMLGSNLIQVFTVTTVFSHLHDWLLRDKSSNPEMEREHFA